MTKKDTELIYSYDEFRRRFFPKEVEKERLAKLTPEERGREIAEQMLANVTKRLAEEVAS